MTTENITLVNEGGKIVGKEPETGDTIPIELGDVFVNDLDANSVSTESAGIGQDVTLQESDDGRLEVIIDG